MEDHTQQSAEQPLTAQEIREQLQALQDLSDEDLAQISGGFLDIVGIAKGKGLPGLVQGHSTALFSGGNAIAQIKAAVYGAVNGVSSDTFDYADRQAGNHPSRP